MKQLFAFLVACAILASCAPRKSNYGCGDPLNLEKRPFRVFNIHTDRNGHYVVSMRHYGMTVTKVYECLPDTIALGKIVMLPSRL